LLRALQRLTALAISRAKAPGYLPDCGGLYLQVTESGSKSWIYRYSLAGKRREMGLGPYPTISLAAARNLAADARSLAKAGRDPIEARNAQRAHQRLEEARSITWERAVDQFLEAHERTWRNSKHRQQWRNTLTVYASPVFEGLAVASIGTGEVTKVLDPIWQEKPATASRVRGRIERVLDWAKVRGYRDGENPARWRGHLDKVFPTKSKIRRVQHHPAVAIDDAPKIYAKLREATGMAALALRYLILTAGRAGEILGAHWSEIDLQAAIWTIPSSRMKAGHAHRVTLSQEALAVLKKTAKYRIGERVFPSSRRGHPISSSSLLKALHAAGGGLGTVHGFRSTFRDWSSERTSFSHEVSEMALAHTIGNHVEAAYRRGELLIKRAAMMEAWASFLLEPPSANVVQLGRHQRA
jgi:integrase